MNVESLTIDNHLIETFERDGIPQYELDHHNPHTITMILKLWNKKYRLVIDATKIDWNELKDHLVR